MKSLKKYLQNEFITPIREADRPVVMYSKPESTFKTEEVFYDAIEDDVTFPIDKLINESSPIKANSTIVSKSFYSSSSIKVIH